MGLAIAERLAEGGHKVYMLDVLKDELTLSARKIVEKGHDAIAVDVDLASEEQLSSLPERIGKPFQDVSILVNNAAIAPKGKDGKRIAGPELALEQWERVLRVNLTVPFRLMQLCIPSMRSQGWGRIVNVSSRGGRSPGGVAGVDYVATKSGILGLTRAFAQDVASAGITVNSIAPGRIETPMGFSSSEAVLNEVRAKIPVGRFGSPEEIAALVGFLVGEEAGFITGAVVDINGGALMI